jgi:viroplasmin and RNaseH domain-containing protein
MTWYVVYRGRKPGVYANWVTCHEQVTGFPNCCYKSFVCKEEATTAFLEFSGHADAPMFDEKIMPANNYILHVVVLVEFLIIIGLLVFIFISK